MHMTGGSGHKNNPRSQNPPHTIHSQHALGGRSDGLHKLGRRVLHGTRAAKWVLLRPHAIHFTQRPRGKHVLITRLPEVEMVAVRVRACKLNGTQRQRKTLILGTKTNGRHRTGNTRAPFGTIMADAMLGMDSMAHMGMSKP